MKNFISEIHYREKKVEQKNARIFLSVFIFPLISCQLKSKDKSFLFSYLVSEFQLHVDFNAKTNRKFQSISLIGLRSNACFTLSLHYIIYPSSKRRNYKEIAKVVLTLNLRPFFFSFLKLFLNKEMLQSFDFYFRHYRS